MGFEIAVENPVRMAVVKTKEELVDDFFDFFFSEGVRFHKLLQIAVDVFEDEVEFVLP